MAKKYDTIQKLLDYFADNEDIFSECIEDLDSWNGILGDDRYLPMDELDELYRGESASYILERAYFGKDYDSWHTDSYGERHYASFNPNREYFTFNGYGNLCSSNWKDYSDKLNEDIILEMLENKPHMYTIDDNEDLRELFDELEEELEKAA